MSEQELAGADTGSAPAPAIDTTPPAVGANVIDTPVNDAPPSIDDTLEAAWNKTQSNGVDRDPSGKFTSGKAADAPADQNSAVQPQEVQPPAPVAPVHEAPHFWTAEEKAELWPKVPPEVQAILRDKDVGYQRTISSQGERLKSFEPLEQLITHHKADFARRGMQPEQAFAVLLDAQAQLDRNPIDGLINIAQTYGIDLRAMLSGQGASLPAQDPRVGQVEQQLSTLRQTVEQQQQALEQQREAEAAATLKEFAKDKPYFEDVRKLMSALMKGGQAESLQDAYDMAVHASPTTRARIEADKRAAQEKKDAELKAKAEEEAKRKAAEASKSARVNVRSSSAHPNPKTMDDTIDEIARRAYGH